MKGVPKSIVIGGRKIRIRVLKRLKDAFGTYDHDAGIISISAEAAADPKVLRGTLIHEIIHGALSVGGVAFLEFYQDEAIVRCLEQNLIPALDNLNARLGGGE